MNIEKGSLRVAHWKGSPIRIHWSVLVGAFFFGRIQFLPVYWICFFFVIFVHEAGHVMVIRQFNLWVDEVVIHGIGGYCRWGGYAEPIPRSLIAWGGAVAQFVLLILAYAAFAFFRPAQSAVTQQVFQAFVISNIWMIFFNLLPFEPLDGVEAWKIVKLMRNDWNAYQRERRHMKQNQALKRQLNVIMGQGPDEEK